MADSGKPGPAAQRGAWHRNPNWLLLLVVIVVGAWLYHLFSQNNAPVAVKPASVPAVATAAPTVARVFQKPTAPATIVQHAFGVGDRATIPTDLTARLARAPRRGDVLLALASTGFGCLVAPGWTALYDGPGSTGLAYRVVRPGDSKVVVPFTTSRASNYTLELVEVAGGPDIIASPRSGGDYVLSSTVSTRIALAIPQTGGILLRLYAASGYAGAGYAAGSGNASSFTGTLPAGQRETLVERVPGRGWGAELSVLATTTDPRDAAQPFTAVETATFADRKSPGNTVAGWLVWVGGRLGARP